jgi:hypothetical protein
MIHRQYSYFDHYFWTSNELLAHDFSVDSATGLSDHQSIILEMKF